MEIFLSQMSITQKALCSMAYLKLQRKKHFHLASEVGKSRKELSIQIDYFQGQQTKVVRIVDIVQLCIFIPPCHCPMTFMLVGIDLFWHITKRTILVLQENKISGKAVLIFCRNMDLENWSIIAEKLSLQPNSFAKDTDVKKLAYLGHTALFSSTKLKISKRLFSANAKLTG